jgi:DNA-binding XRE family transcriptional regulator
MAQESAAMEFPNKILDVGEPQTAASYPSMKEKLNSPGHKSALTGKSSPSSRLDIHSAADDRSAVSSITGAGFDQEIVEEMHMALTALRAELEESRAEAARAVKIAEQAIQSAEKSNSKDWNSTVTHKAAEAAALAQKKSAEALSRARLAEEKLESERRNASIWKKQAQVAEEEAGYWQTRAAAAEVDKAGIAESLESERSNIVALLSSMREKTGFESDGKRSRALEAELNIIRSTLASKDAEVKALRECLAEVYVDTLV